MKKIIVYGGLNMDLSMECDRLPVPGESLRGSNFVATPGGKGGNEAVAAARMGAETFMVGKVGNDHYGRKLTSELVAHGVSVNNVSVTARDETGVSLVLRCGTERSVVTDPGANAKMSYEEVRAAIHGLGQHSNILLMSLGGGIDVAMQSLACAKRNDLFVILRASVVEGMKLPDEAYAGLDLLVINRTDCRILSGLAPTDDGACARALEFFAGRGVRQCVITLKGGGSVTLVDGEMVRVAGRKVEVVDPSCAGDTYAGTLATCLADDMPLKESMEFATAAAALAITKVGAQESIPSWKQAQDFLKAAQE